ncbi:hypothetical protein VKT23_007445 [Stygiomarasmius scandens]|uniref:Uncharacterized protein n=1 Tax=Marasmiellus scandens TaxID=2682957 RepID=A0ABR1JJW1_9AGAR
MMPPKCPRTQSSLTNPLLQAVTHFPASDSFAHELHQNAFIQKNRGAFFSPVQAIGENGLPVPVLDAQGRAYEHLKAPLRLEGHLPLSILVLAEYRAVLSDIDYWFQHDEQETIPTLVSPDDYTWARWIDFSNQVGGKDRDKENQGRSDHALFTATGIEGGQVKDNDGAEKNEPPRHQSVQVIGIPGIGKSLFLLYILVERLVRGLDTCLQTESNYFTLWCADGAFDIPLGPEFDAAMAPLTSCNLLPETTWFLLDSNKAVSAPSSRIQDSYARIIQVSLPKLSRLDWVSKQSVSLNCRYMMKPPSLKEVILMKSSQCNNAARSIPDEKISDFFYKYGPSARMIFKYADKTLAYERDLRGKVNKIGATILCKLVNQTRDFVQEPEGVSQLILGVYPGSDREEIVVNILTEYIYQLVKNAHGDNWDKEARKMYSLFHRNAETRACAGYVFEDRIHEVLQQGNSWKATKLERSNPRKNAKNAVYNHSPTFFKWLHAGRDVDFSDQPPAAAGALTAPDVRRYDADHALEVELKQSGYYRPYLPNFDSYMVNMDKKKVVVFEFTVSGTHDAKVSGLEWLQRHYNDFEVHYVVFTALSDIKVYIPIAFDSFLKTKSHVVVTEAQLFA